MQATETHNLSISTFPLETFHKAGGGWSSAQQDLDLCETNLNSKISAVYEGVLRRRPVI